MTAAVQLPLVPEPLVDVFVAGDPKPKGSPMGFVVGKPGARKRAIVTHKATSGTTAWLKAVRWTVQQATSVLVERGQPVRAELLFVLPRPMRALKKRTGYALAAKVPDLDKLVRCCFDSLSNVVFADDSQVVQLTCEKRVADPGERPGVRIRLWALS